MTKLHSVISQAINTQHGLRSIMQPATPVVSTGKLSAARASERQDIRGPDYEANSKSAIRRQIVSTSFLEVKLKNKQ